MDATHTNAWAEHARTMAEKEFVARYAGYFLLVSLEPVEVPTMLDTLSGEQAAALKNKIGRRSFEIRRIEKSKDVTKDGPERDKVLVGRTRSCDVGFRHPSVSKVHACFQSKGKGLMVTDLRSRNGTRLNGDILESEIAHPVQVKDRVQFGSVGCLVLDAPALYDFLMKTV
jgi:pSer/pThr/pTyr-binding forkhead associated (FHA) protein